MKPWSPDCGCRGVSNEVGANSSQPSFLIFYCAPWSTCHLPICGNFSLKVHLVVPAESMWDDSNPLPDLRLRVDFNGLAAFHRPPGTTNRTQRDSLKVYPALTNITEDALATTPPTLLFPGMNLIGVVKPVLRQRFRAPGLSAFGLFEVSPLK
jgi:hypothetical protein